MTLSVLESHSPVASFFKCDILYLWGTEWSLCICIASCYFTELLNTLKTTHQKALPPDCIRGFISRPRSWGFALQASYYRHDLGVRHISMGFWPQNFGARTVIVACSCRFAAFRAAYRKNSGGGLKGSEGETRIRVEGGVLLQGGESLQKL